MPDEPPERRWIGPGHGLMARVLRSADRVQERTPPDRERSVDGLRALAVCAVVLGHWFVTAPVLWEDGALRPSSPLRAMPELAPLSWLLQALALFFLVGGYAAVLGHDRARRRGDSYMAWVGGRLLRLGRPIVALTALWGLALTTMVAFGVPEATVRTVMMLVLQPLWFLGVYALVTALTPVLVALEGRLGAGAALATVGMVALVDLAYLAGPLPAWIGLVNVLPVWGCAYLLGISWARGRLTTGICVTLVVVGMIVLLSLTTRLGYPVSAVGVPGAERSNTDPPSLLLAVLGMTQSGAAVLVATALGRFLRRPLPWALVAWINLNALTVFCWHLTALAVPALIASLLSPHVPVAGLTTAPDDLAWIVDRLAWLPLSAAVTLVSCLLLNRFESPWSGVPARGDARTVAGIGVASFALAALTLY